MNGMKSRKHSWFCMLALLLAAGCGRDMQRPDAAATTLVLRGTVLTGENTPVSFARLRTEVRPLNCPDTVILSDTRDIAGEFAVALPAHALPSRVCVVTIVDPTPAYAIPWDDIRTERDSITLVRDSTNIELDIRYDFALIAGGITLLGPTTRRVEDVRFEISGGGRTENYLGQRSIDYLRFDPGTIVTVRAWYATPAESGGPVSFSWTAAADRRVGFNIMVGRGDVRAACAVCAGADSASIAVMGTGVAAGDSLFIAWTTPQQISDYTVF